MAEMPDWKARYRDAIREMEDHERDWRELERALRRMVGRLCTLGLGVAPTVDAELQKISRQAQSEGGTAAEIDDLVKSLLHAVTTNNHPRGRWSASCNAVVQLLERLSTGAAPDPAMQALVAEVPTIDSDEDLAKLLTRAADLAKERADKFEKERASAAAMMAQVTQRLEDVASFLSGSKADWKTSQDAAMNLNRQVLTEVDGLSKEAVSATDLEPLQALVASRLESIQGHVREFRARQDKLFVEQAQRTDKMTVRVAELERQARDLSSSLEKERQRARIDVVTGVPNRSAFEERLHEELERWKRFRTPVSMLVWDIDRFKKINDTYGHRAGDRVLREVANCFANRLRASDFIARIGGEEFCTLLVGTEIEAAMRVANELREAVGSLKLLFHGQPVRVTVSCGVTTLRDSDAGDGGTIFERADAALYRAKDGGRNLCIAA
jgi:diguanylate cyclase